MAATTDTTTICAATATKPILYSQYANNGVISIQVGVPRRVDVRVCGCLTPRFGRISSEHDSGREDGRADDGAGDKPMSTTHCSKNEYRWLFFFFFGTSGARKRRRSVCPTATVSFPLLTFLVPNPTPQPDTSVEATVAWKPSLRSPSRKTLRPHHLVPLCFQALGTRA